MIETITWERYEEIVRYIYEYLGRVAGVRIECSGAACKVPGKISGVSHQIDVLAAHSDGIHTYYTAIECKYWKERINKDIVMKIEAIVRDCGFDKGVIVSKEGFTDDATKYAANVKIALVELKEHNWKSEGDHIIKTYYNIRVTRAFLANINLIVAPALLNDFASSPFKEANSRE